MEKVKLKRYSESEGTVGVPTTVVYTWPTDLIVANTMALWHDVHGTGTSMLPSKVTLFSDGRATFLYRVSNSSHHAKWYGRATLEYRFNTSPQPVPELPNVELLFVEMSHNRHTYYQEWQGEAALHHPYGPHFSWLNERPDIDAFITWAADRIE